MSKKESLEVIYRNKTIAFINPKLLDIQKKWDNIKKIKNRMRLKCSWLNALKRCKKKERKHVLVILKKIEFLIQEAWGFEPNEMFHRVWEYPHCKCPKMDNEDRWGIELITNPKCSLHGSTK